MSPMQDKQKKPEQGKIKLLSQLSVRGVSRVKYICEFHYMLSYADTKFTSRVPIHAVLRRYEMYFT